MAVGSGKITWLVDFTGCNAGRDLPMSLRLQFIRLLQRHYPARLGLLVGYQAPVHIGLVFKVRYPPHNCGDEQEQEPDTSYIRHVFNFS